MTSIKHLEIAVAVSSHKDIIIKRSLLGLVQKAIYTPTNSPLTIIVHDYTPSEGERLKELLNLPLDKMEGELTSKDRPIPAPIGHFHLEACISEDRQFCALQLFRFVDFKYSPVFETRFYSGKDVETIYKLL